MGVRFFTAYSIASTRLSFGYSFTFTIDVLHCKFKKNVHAYTPATFLLLFSNQFLPAKILSLGRNHYNYYYNMCFISSFYSCVKRKVSSANSATIRRLSSRSNSITWSSAIYAEPAITNSAIYPISVRNARV